MPGDSLFRYVDPADPLDAQITNAIIQSGQVTVQSTSDATEAVDRSLRALLGEDQRDREAWLLGIESSYGVWGQRPHPRRLRREG